MLGVLVNIRDGNVQQSSSYSNHRMDQSSQLKHRNILCSNRKDHKGIIEALYNQLNDQRNQTEQQSTMDVSIYCDLGIMHSVMYKKLDDSQRNKKLAAELMTYHLQVSDDDVKILAGCQIPPVSSIHPEFTSFSFTPRLIADSQSPLAVLSMMEDLNMISRWNIDRDSLARFILRVQRGYRDCPYHNWNHAFSVGHFCYLLLTRARLVEKGLLSPLEGLSLMIACLCHDLDHRGTNNSFQVASKSILAALYSSEGSVMERHHLAQTIGILNSEGCNVLHKLSSKEYRECLDNIGDIILATDLAQHIRILNQLTTMVKEGYDIHSPQHHKLLLCLLMTSCDLSDQSKDWNSSKKIAELVYTEFFCQGDLEKAMGARPQDMMDRDRACIPELQVTFLGEIALPVYRLLNELLPEVFEPLTCVRTNISHWQKMGDVCKRRELSSALEIFHHPDL